MKPTSKMTKGIFVSLLLAVPLFAGQAFAQGGTWTAKAAMPTPQSGAVAGVINGQLYVMGGNAAPGVVAFPPPTAYEAYNPATDTWATKASAPTPREYAGADVINNKLYVVGGCINTDCSFTTNVLEAYDPATDTWVSLAPMPTVRTNMAVGAIGGKLYVAGGSLFFTTFTTLEVYDPSTNTWDTTKRPMPVGQSRVASAVVNGKLYVIGGVSDLTLFNNAATLPSARVGTVQAYDPVSDTWSSKATMPTPRESAAAGVVNGLVYVVGGDSNSGVVSLPSEVYDPSANTWTTGTAMPTARNLLAVGVINGVLYAAGGNNGSGNTGNIGANEAFTPGNTPAGTNVEVTPVDTTTGTSPVTLTFSNVTQAGTTTLTTSGTGSPPPTGFKLGNPATYFQLTTTAVFSGPVTICINYSGISFGNASKLRLFHFEGGAWVNVTVSLDTTNKVICGGVTSLSPFAIFEFAYAAMIQPPIAANGSSVFNASRGVVPVKFTLALDGVPTCNLPPAMISVFRMSAGTLTAINQSDFTMPSDTGSNFRIDTTNCQYVYNLASSSLGPGTYLVQISIGDVIVGSASFGLQ